MTPRATRERVVVTGATGFLGGNVVPALVERGYDVVALGRNVDVGLSLAGAEFLPVDLRERDALIAACARADVVIHAGALSTAWGRDIDFFATNVVGTANVVAACLTHDVRRLVHISSPSVLSTLSDQLDLDEQAPFPAAFVSAYSKSKKLAEDQIAAGRAHGLRAVILRPKAIYGVGDTAILPRIITALKSGRLPRIGDGHAVTQLTHVADVANAVIASINAETVDGRVINIAGETVRIWELIDEIADRLAAPRPTRQVSAERAMRLAAGVERTWKTLGIRREPPLTQYGVAILAWSQTYNNDQARRLLNWSPSIRVEESLDDVLEPAAPLPRRTPTRSVVMAPTRARVQLLSAGSSRAIGRALGGDQPTHWIDVPNLFGVITHPTRGVVLFDTGYSERFYEGTSCFPYSLYRRVTPVTVTPEETAAAQLRELGIDPLSVAAVVLSHFDPDHVGGLHDFPNARIVCSAKAWTPIAGVRGLRALYHRILPGTFPADTTSRLALMGRDRPHDVLGLPVIDDLFGDGSIRVVDLPGHTPGHIGALVETSERGPMLLVGDAIWTRGVIDDGASSGVHGLIAANRRAQRATYELLRDFRATHSTVPVIPSHCPATASEFLHRVEHGTHWYAGTPDRSIGVPANA